jgi:bacterioferritin
VKRTDRDKSVFCSLENVLELGGTDSISRRRSQYFRLRQDFGGVQCEAAIGQRSRAGAGGAHGAQAGNKNCLDAHDDASRELLEHIVVDEEHHIDWIETQQHQIKEIGYENYLAQQIFKKS